jgi:tetratricopeptide (TPR) repeat protein
MTLDLANELDRALGLHQNGRLDQASRIYRRLLEDDPDNADVLHLLGLTAHQQGDHARAVELIGRAIAVRPSIAVFHANLAEVYRALRQYERAAGCGRTALRLQADFAEAANHLGLALLDWGKTEEAIAQFEKAVRLKPELAMAHNNLGNAWRTQGDRERAAEQFRKAAALDPQLAEAHSNLGQILLELGDLEQAALHCREAIRLRPNCAEAHNNLGNVFREQERLTDARACYAEALRLKPDLALAYGNMGQVLQEDGSLAEAVTWYRQALDLDPNSARLHCFLASACEEQEEYEQAVAGYEKALELEPDYAEAHNGLGWVRHEQGRFDDAMKLYRTALRLRADYPSAECNLGMLQLELAEFTAAEATFRELLRRRPQHAGAHAQLAILLRGQMPEADVQALRQLLQEADLSASRRASLQFGLAQVYDARGQFAEAAELLREANALALAQRQKSGLTYEPADHTRFADTVLDAFTADLFARLSSCGLDTERPVFVVGLPRSGTTLTEQVLASHSCVFGAGELRLAREDLLALSPNGEQRSALAALSQVDGAALRALAQRHLDRLGELDGKAARIVDKMPDNYLYLGLLALLFPKAKFIHCRRDMRDVAVSCWMTQFRHIRWANDFDHIASRFQEYQRLMEHWRRVLPVPMLEVNYEEMVADLEGTARRLVSWCGLEWEPACLAFHEGKRPVRTASVTQVRQPIYTRSVARWKHYEPALAPLFARFPDNAIVNKS